MAPVHAARSPVRPRSGPYQRTPQRPPLAVLLAALLTATLLAGCHGLPHEPANAPVGRPAPDQTNEGTTDATGGAPPEPTGRNDLPIPRLDARIDGPEAELVIHLDGNPDTIATHRIDFGDDSTPVEGDGAPAQRYTHTYPAPPDFRHYDATFTASLVLRSAQGHDRIASTEVTIPAPPNQAPIATLNLSHVAGPAPLRTLIAMNGHDSDGSIQSWRLDLGDGSAPVIGPDRPERAYQHDFRTIGTHTVRLTFTDDRGLDGHTETTVTVWPPQQTRIWTVDSETQHVTMQDGNGTIRADHDVRRPTCGRSTDCETPIDIATGAGYAYALLHRPQTNGSVWVLDADTGRGRYTVTVGLHPNAIWTDAKGNAWVTHATSGQIARIAPGSHRATFLDTPLDDESHKRAAFSDDGRHAWFLGRHDPALLVHVDPTTRTVDTVPLPAGLDPVALTHQDSNGVALVAGGDGRVLYIAWENGIPVVRDLVDTDPPSDATATAIACHGRDHCWLAIDGGSRDSHIVRIPARPDPAAVTAPRLASITLPAPMAPTGLTARADAVVVMVGGKDAHGTLLIDPATATISKSDITNRTAPGGRDATPHATQPHLVYVDAPDLPGWRLIDTKVGRTVHEARLPFVADAFDAASAP